jgi:hypothetical protein
MHLQNIPEMTCGRKSQLWNIVYTKQEERKYGTLCLFICKRENLDSRLFHLSSSCESPAESQ